MADISEELLDKLNIDGSLTAKEFAHMILFENDKSDIDEIRRNFKKNFLDKFRKELDEIKTKDIKQIFDPLNLSDILRDPEALREEFKEYKNKLRKELRKAKKKLDDGALDLGASLGLNISNKGGTEEQKTFGEKPIKIEFSEDTNKFISDLFVKYSAFKDKEIKEKEDKEKQLKSGFSMLDLITLAIGGGLLAYYWNSHIRPYLEEKFDFMGRLEGIFNGFEKFIYVSVPKLILNVVGGSLERIDKVIQVVKTGIKTLFGFGSKAATELAAEGASKAGVSLAGKAATTAAGQVATEAVVETGVKAATSGVSKGLIGKLGGTFLKLAKGIPLIGAFISVGFAQKRMEEGDTVGAVIDYIGALGSLMEIIPFPPVAIAGAALSWGAIGLNALLDLKAEGNTPQEKNASKFNTLKSWVAAPFKFLLNLGWVKSIMNAGKGLWMFGDGAISGNTSGTISGLKTLQDSFLSPIANMLLPIYESNTVIDVKTGNKKFDWNAIWKDWMKKILKKLPDWLYDIVAPYVIGDGEPSIQSIDKTKIANKSESMDARMSTNKQIDELESIKYVDKEKEKERLNNIKILKDNISALDEVDKMLAEQSAKNSKFRREKDASDEPQNRPWPYDQMNDGEAEIKIGQNRIKVNPQDTINLIASKPDGAFSEVFKNLGTGFEQMVKEVKNLGTTLNQNSRGNSSYVSINGAGNQINPFTIMDDGPLRARRSYLSTTPRVI
jgi:hypothetical protein